MQKIGELYRKYCRVHFGKKWACCAALLLLGALACRAGEPIAVDKVFVVIHQNAKTKTRDPFLFVHSNISTRERPLNWFSLRADYSHFTYQDEFCLRRDAGVLGLKAVFTF